MEVKQKQLDLSLSSSSLIPYTTPSREINHNNANLFACIWMLWCVSLSLVRLTNLIQWSTRFSRATITLYLLILYFVFCISICYNICVSFHLCSVYKHMQLVCNFRIENVIAYTIHRHYYHHHHSRSYHDDDCENVIENSDGTKNMTERPKSLFMLSIYCCCRCCCCQCGFVYFKFSTRIK